MIRVRIGLSIGVLALVFMLSVLEAGSELGLWGWAVGLGCGAVLSAATVRCAASASVELLGPADVVTLFRVTLSCGIGALVADSVVRDLAMPTVVVLAACALALDAVDGRVARRTGTASAFGARLDGEADAFLMLVLSVYVARSTGTWVIAMGAARYAFAMAGWMLPWMRAQLPPRYWRKVVTAIAGISLVYAASDVGSAAKTDAALAVGSLLLVESFGRDVWWLWCRRPAWTRATQAESGAALRSRQLSS